MNILSYFQLAMAILMSICVWVLAIKNLMAGHIGISGGIVAVIFIILTSLNVLFAIDEIRDMNNSEKTLRRQS